MAKRKGICLLTISRSSVMRATTLQKPGALKRAFPLLYKIILESQEMKPPPYWGAKERPTSLSAEVTTQ
jgi:lambda repressor-like predicted transcriptional regulator